MAKIAFKRKKRYWKPIWAVFSFGCKCLCHDYRHHLLRQNCGFALKLCTAMSPSPSPSVFSWLTDIFPGPRKDSGGQGTLSKIAASSCTSSIFACVLSHISTLQNRHLNSKPEENYRTYHFSLSSVGTLKIQVPSLILSHKPECFHLLHWSLGKNQLAIGRCK